MIQRFAIEEFLKELVEKLGVTFDDYCVQCDGKVERYVDSRDVAHSDLIQFVKTGCKSFTEKESAKMNDRIESRIGQIVTMIVFVVALALSFMKATSCP